jgi:cell division protein FtsX
VRPRLLVASLLTAVALAGCTSGNDEQEQRPEIDLNANAEVSVLLDQDITDAERGSVESQLRAVPDAQTVTYRSPQESYQRLNKSPAPEASTLRPEQFPGTLVLKFTTMDALVRERQGGLEEKVKAWKGVADVIFPICVTQDECQSYLQSGPPSPTGSDEPSGSDGPSGSGGPSGSASEGAEPAPSAS